MRALILFAAAVLFSVAGMAVVRAGDLAYVRAGDSAGQAWLFTRGGVCYALTPAHVVGADTYARLLAPRPNNQPGREAQGDLCGVFPSHDLALVRVTGLPLQECGAPLASVANMDALLASAPEASIESATEAGGIMRMPLVVGGVMSNDRDHFWVVPRRANDEVAVGMSGSRVLIGERIAGIMLSVANENSSAPAGAGLVLRVDRAAQLATRAFEAPNTLSRANAACFGPVSRGERANHRASASCGARVLEWSAPPLDAASRPENISDANPLSVWRARGAAEVSVRTRLCGAAAPISRVTISTQGCQSGDNAGYTVDVSVRANNGPAVQLGFAQMIGSEIVVQTGSPMVADEVGLRFVGRAGAAAPVCVGSLIAE